MKKDIKPIVLTNTETNETYTLEFTRETVAYAQSKGFDIEDIEKKPLVAIPDLFYYAFRANHKYMSREQTTKVLYDDLGGLPNGVLDRLAELYYAPYQSLFESDESERKNSKMTVEL